MFKVLIVDDSAFIRRILKNMIQNLGIDTIDEASDGYEAVQKTRNNNYDVVFMDIMMPKMNGLEAIKAIIPSNPGINIIVCSSVAQDKITAEAIQAGAKEYVAKPFNAQEINKVIEKFLPKK